MVEISIAISAKHYFDETSKIIVQEIEKIELARRNQSVDANKSDLENIVEDSINKIIFYHGLKLVQSDKTTFTELYLLDIRKLFDKFETICQRAYDKIILEKKDRIISEYIDIIEKVEQSESILKSIDFLDSNNLHQYDYTSQIKLTDKNSRSFMKKYKYLLHDREEIQEEIINYKNITIAKSDELQVLIEQILNDQNITLWMEKNDNFTTQINTLLTFNLPNFNQIKTNEIYQEILNFKSLIQSTFSKEFRYHFNEGLTLGLIKETNSLKQLMIRVEILFWNIVEKYSLRYYEDCITDILGIEDDIIIIFDEFQLANSLQQLIDYSSRLDIISEEITKFTLDILNVHIFKPKSYIIEIRDRANSLKAYLHGIKREITDKLNLIKTEGEIEILKNEISALNVFLCDDIQQINQLKITPDGDIENFSIIFKILNDYKSKIIEYRKLGFIEISDLLDTMESNERIAHDLFFQKSIQYCKQNIMFRFLKNFERLDTEIKLIHDSMKNEKLEDIKILKSLVDELELEIQEITEVELEDGGIFHLILRGETDILENYRKKRLQLVSQINELIDKFVHFTESREYLYKINSITERITRWKSSVLDVMDDKDDLNTIHKNYKSLLDDVKGKFELINRQKAISFWTIEFEELEQLLSDFIKWENYLIIYKLLSKVQPVISEIQKSVNSIENNFSAEAYSKLRETIKDRLDVSLLHELKDLGDKYPGSHSHNIMQLLQDHININERIIEIEKKNNEYITKGELERYEQNFDQLSKDFSSFSAAQLETLGIEIFKLGSEIVSWENQLRYPLTNTNTKIFRTLKNEIEFYYQSIFDSYKSSNEREMIDKLEFDFRIELRKLNEIYDDKILKMKDLKAIELSHLQKSIHRIFTSYKEIELIKLCALLDVKSVDMILGWLSGIEQMVEGIKIETNTLHVDTDKMKLEHEKIYQSFINWQVKLVEMQLLEDKTKKINDLEIELEMKKDLNIDYSQLFPSLSFEELTTRVKELEPEVDELLGTEIDESKLPDDHDNIELLKQWITHNQKISVNEFVSRLNFPSDDIAELWIMDLYETMAMSVDINNISFKFTSEKNLDTVLESYKNLFSLPLEVKSEEKPLTKPPIMLTPKLLTQNNSTSTEKLHKPMEPLNLKKVQDAKVRPQTNRYQQSLVEEPHIVKGDNKSPTSVIRDNQTTSFTEIKPQLNEDKKYDPSPPIQQVSNLPVDYPPLKYFTPSEKVLRVIPIDYKEHKKSHMVITDAGFHFIGEKSVARWGGKSIFGPIFTVILTALAYFKKRGDPFTQFMIEYHLINSLKFAGVLSLSMKIQVRVNDRLVTSEFTGIKKEDMEFLKNEISGHVESLRD